IFFSSRRLHTISKRDWSSDVCSSDLKEPYIGIDIDDVGTDIQRYLSDDTDDNIVAEFIDTLGSYAEVSPSGNGVHIIIKGELPKIGRAACREGRMSTGDAGESNENNN